MSFKLYELTGMYQDMWDLITDEEQDLDALEIALKGLEGSIEEKVENTAKLVKSIEANAKTIQEEERRLAKKRRAMSNKADRIKEQMEYLLRAADIDKVQGDMFTVALQNNPPSVHFTNEDLIPKEYQRVKVDYPKRAILDAINEGKEVPGAEVIQSKSLRIR